MAREKQGVLFLRALTARKVGTSVGGWCRGPAPLSARPSCRVTLLGPITGVTPRRPCRAAVAAPAAGRWRQPPGAPRERPELSARVLRQRRLRSAGEAPGARAAAETRNTQAAPCAAAGAPPSCGCSLLPSLRPPPPRPARGRCRGPPGARPPAALCRLRQRGCRWRGGPGRARPPRPGLGTGGLGLGGVLSLAEQELSPRTSVRRRLPKAK